MSDITTTRIFTDGERGITAAKLNDITASSSIQPAFYTSKPTASTADPADVALILKAGAYSQVPISALAGSATQAQIWDTRLRTYNSVGNPNFEIDQRQCGASVPFNNAIDRWAPYKAGTMALTGQQITSGYVQIPGTSYNITRSFYRATLTTAQATLGASDNIQIMQALEGIQIRELVNDVHSIQLLVRSSVAGLKFGVSLRDSNTTHSLCKLCTITTSNVWTLIALPNLPSMVSSGGNFPSTPGLLGVFFMITLGAGSTLIAPANDVWQTGNYIGALGQSNYAASPVNSTFDIAFVQHEPGGVCSTLMDKPFSTNLDECLRYYCKSYDYSTPVATVNVPGYRVGSVFGVAPAQIWFDATFPKLMAKIPTVTPYNYASGAANSVYFNGIAVATSGVAVSTAGIQNVTIPSQGVSAGQAYLGYMHFTADTGW